MRKAKAAPGCSARSQADLSDDLRIGISGWTYRPWRGVFYPPKHPQKRELEYASRAFNTIEINGTFYSLQRPSSFQKWYSETPAGFLFSIKGARFITHMKKLRDVAVPLANFFASGVLCLREKLGPILWQFPPNFGWNEKRFREFFEMLPRNTEEAAELAEQHNEKLRGRAWTKTDACRPLRYAVEIRHPSFLALEFYALLREYQVAFVIADTAGKWPYAEELTANFVYCRLHGDHVFGGRAGGLSRAGGAGAGRYAAVTSQGGGNFQLVGLPDAGFPEKSRAANRCDSRRKRAGGKVQRRGCGS